MERIDYDDPAVFETVGPVYILDEHVLPAGPDGEELVVDEAFLRAVAANNNRRVRVTGDAAAIVVGHTRDGEAEADGPELIGFATDYGVVPFFETGKKALACLFRVYKAKVPMLAEFPRRSVELWVSKKEVDPISLLSASAPERDLGPLVRFSRGASPTTVYRYSCPKGDTPMTDCATKYEAKPDAGGDDEVVAKVFESSRMKSLEAKIDQILGLLDADGGDEDDFGDGDDAPPDDAGGMHADDAAMDDLLADDPATDAKPGEKEQRSKHEPPPVRFSGSAPAAANTFLPGSGDKTKMSRTPDDVVKLQRESATLRAELADVKMKLSRSAATATVTELVAAGYQIADAKEETDILAALSDAGKAKHVERIKKNYARAPIAAADGSQPDFLRYARGDKGPMTAADAQKAVDMYSRGQAKTYEDALKQLGFDAK